MESTNQIFWRSQLTNLLMDLKKKVCASSVNAAYY